MVPASVSRCAHALAIAVAPRMRGVEKRERPLARLLFIGEQGVSPLPTGMPPIARAQGKLASGMKNSLALVVKNGLSPMVKNALRA